MLKNFLLCALVVSVMFIFPNSANALELQTDY